MSTHLAALAAVSRVLAETPVPRGTTVTIDLRHCAYDGTAAVSLGLHGTPAALTEALTSAIGATRTSDHLERLGGYYRVTNFTGPDQHSAAHYGPHLGRQGWRTTSRRDVARCTT